MDLLSFVGPVYQITWLSVMEDIVYIYWFLRMDFWYRLTNKRTTEQLTGGQKIPILQLRSFIFSLTTHSSDVQAVGA